jgi:putative ABC transport system permease protein
VTRLGLTLSAFRRHRGRAVFTVLSVAAAFAIFTILAAIEEGIDGKLSLTSAQRLDTITTVSVALPVSYAAVIRSIPGVVSVTYDSGFDGHFRNAKQDVPVIAFAIPSALKVYPEFTLPADQEHAFDRDREGAIVGDVLARKMRWHVGETIPIQGGPPQKNGSTTWFFHIDGIYRTDLPGGYQELFVVNYDYFNEGLAASPIKDTVQGFTELIDDSKNMDRVEHAIDARFTNASPDTRTASEQQDIMSSTRQFGDIGAILTYVGLAVFGSMLLITGNTMANSVRERMGEFAMMRALGFGRWQLAIIVLRESAILVGVGASLGVLAGWGMSGLMEPIMTSVLRGFTVTWVAVVLAAVFALFFALVTGLLPVHRVAHLEVAAALRSA